MRYHPIFVLDSRERYAPVAVEAVVHAKAKLRPSGVALTGLDQLVAPAARIDFPAQPERWAPALQERFGPVGYLRRVLGGGLVWLQYWLFYLHNPKAYLLTGDHEGDWEFVQVGYAAGGTPVCVTCSEHHAGGARMWWDVERRDGRPVVYVARDSHANYFAPVAEVEDQADGRGRVLDAIEWREPAAWASWPGRWGNSTGEGKSPESPAIQRQRWDTPHIFHSRAEGRP